MSGDEVPLPLNTIMQINWLPELRSHRIFRLTSLMTEFRLIEIVQDPEK